MFLVIRKAFEEDALDDDLFVLDHISDPQWEVFLALDVVLNVKAVVVLLDVAFSKSFSDLCDVNATKFHPFLSMLAKFDHFSLSFRSREEKYFPLTRDI